ncbi:hypothetical protein P8452_59874 [Trifolium repens]|nr:hypothetical protein P8452_59874 [Trifolium repens]
MAEKNSEERVWLKLLVNKERNKVLFAEAGKDFVDVLFSFLTLPLGTIARLLQKPSNTKPQPASTVGCFNSLYQSVADLNKSYFLTKTTKEMLLQPMNSSEDYCSTLKLNIDDTPPAKYFLCTNLGGNCYYNSRPAFVITDDLIVMPNSKNVTSFGLLQNFGIKSTSSLQQMAFNVTKEKVLDLLRCSLISKSPLTDLFLRKKISVERLPRFLNFDVESSTNIQISVKLVIRKSDGKILYAQGEEDFADMLISFLTFPLGGIVKKLKGNCSLGSIDRLYKSIVDLDENRYFKSEKAKSRLVDPPVALQFKLNQKILPIQPEMNYYCYYHGKNLKECITHNQFFISDEVRTNEKYRLNMRLVNTSGNQEGYFQGLKMYVVTDDLVVTRSSPISSSNLIDSSESSLDDLKEKVVTIGVKECLSILMAALTSTSALTNGLAHLLTEVKEEEK